MKISFTTLLLLTLLLFNISLKAQSEITLSKNDSLIVELGGYEGGDIFWECSNKVDNANWLNIASAQNKNVLRHKVTTPYYFRSKVVDGTCEPYYSNIIKVSFAEIFHVKAGHGYAEPYTPNAPGITMNEKGVLSNWSNTNRKAVWYLYQKAGKYEVSMHLRSANSKEYNFEMKTSPCYEGLEYNPETFDFICTSTGSNNKDTISIFNVNIPQTGYYRYELTPKSTNIQDLTIEEFLFTGLREPGQSGTMDTHATDYLSSPSVHLGFNTTQNTSGEYDWIYEEILVPEGYDPLYTYWMSLGFFRGYMGIQTNSENERRVLFSAWDAVDKDKYPNAPKELLVSLVDKADYTKANAFGNEGTGGQSYVGVGNPNTWKTGTPVKFLMNARRDGSITYNGDIIRHTIVSAWYDAGEGWRYIASWRIPVMPDGKDMFDGFYSFLENYGWRNGQIARKGYYYNAFAKETGKTNWTHFNEVSFGNTDGSVGQRIDFEQGVSEEEPDKFYMLSAGYGKTRKTGNQLPYINYFPYLEELDLTPFIQRVDVALEREEELNNLVLKNKSNWRVISFTSEETSGEQNGNGRASLIIDGDTETYWHSKWTGGGSAFPHRFVIDMNQEETIKGFKFTLSGGSSRHPKNIKLEYSHQPLELDSPEWEENNLLSLEAPDEDVYILRLDTPTTFRYLRLSILDGYNDDVHTRINEIDAY